MAPEYVTPTPARGIGADGTDSGPEGQAAIVREGRLR